MTDNRYIELENEVLREILSDLKRKARKLIALIEMEGEDLNEAIEDLKEELEW